MRYIMSFVIVISMVMAINNISCQGEEKKPTGLVIEYSTGSIPPPYNYTERTVIDFNNQANSINVNYSREYQYRDTLSEEELKGEDEDLQWKGEFDGEWYEDFYKFAIEFETYKPRPDIVGGDSTTMKVEFEGGEEKSGYLKEDERWDRLLRELTLAIKQNSGRFVSNTFRLAEVKDNGETEVTVVELNYFTRSGKASLFVEDRLEGTVDLDIKDFRRVRSTIYGPNYYADGESDELPEDKGIYFDRGRETWYSVEKGMKDPSGRSGTVEKLLNTFEEFKKEIK